MSMSAAYTAGKDCALYGANTRNCHSSFFATRDSMKEWERGNRDGMRVKQAKAKGGAS